MLACGERTSEHSTCFREFDRQHCGHPGHRGEVCVGWQKCINLTDDANGIDLTEVEASWQVVIDGESSEKMIPRNIPDSEEEEKLRNS